MSIYSNNLMIGMIILFIVISIASNTLNWMANQTNKELVEIVKNTTQDTNSVSKQNNGILKLLEDRIANST